MCQGQINTNMETNSYIMYVVRPIITKDFISPEGLSIFSTLIVQSFFSFCDKPFKVGMLEGLPDLKVSVEVKRVKVTP